MDILLMEKIKSDEIISILSNVIQKHILKSTENNGVEENE